MRAYFSWCPSVCVCMCVRVCIFSTFCDNIATFVIFGGIVVYVQMCMEKCNVDSKQHNSTLMIDDTYKFLH